VPIHLDRMAGQAGHGIEQEVGSMPVRDMAKSLQRL
jgi:hypothetical protein